VIEDDYPDLADWPTADKSIEAIRDIAERHASKVIDGVFVDASTAHAIVLVHDALNDENRERLMGFPIERIGSIAWRLVK